MSVSNRLVVLDVVVAVSKYAGTDIYADGAACLKWSSPLERFNRSKASLEAFSFVLRDALQDARIHRIGDNSKEVNVAAQVLASSFRLTRSHC